MSDSVFTRMLKGEIPREIVYEDDICFVIPTIAPNNPGHCMVIPNEQIENWEDLDDSTLSHLIAVAKKIALAQKQVYKCPKVGIATVGFEVPHVHIHVIPLYKLGDADHTHAKPVELELVQPEARKIRTALEKGINS